MDRVWIGLEVGTQGVRAAVFDDSGLRLASGRARRPPRAPVAGAMVHLPGADWWEGAREALAGALTGVAGRPIAGIGLAGLFPAVCLARRDGTASSEGVLYGDQRAAETSELAEERLGGEDLDGDEVAPRLMDLLRAHPEIDLDDCLAVGPAGFLALRLTGVPSLDPHSASRWGGLIGPGGWSWDDDAPGTLGIPTGLLPPIVAPGTPLGSVTAAAAAETGLPEGTPVVAGTTDSLATMLGAGVVRQGDALAYYGSTGTLLLVTMDLERALREPGTIHAATPYRRVAHATGSGLFAELVRREWLGSADHETLAGEAAVVAPGADGLMVVPYLSGRVMPSPAPALRGGIAGIGPGHGRGHLWRAVLEAFGWVLMAARADGSTGAGEVRHVTAAGGGARSEVWRGIVTDMTGWPQDVAPQDATVRGAALLAAQSLGARTFDQLAAPWTSGGSSGSAPRPALTERYRAMLPAWLRLVSALAELAEQDTPPPAGTDPAPILDST